jgi:transposase-like protein
MDGTHRPGRKPRRALTPQLITEAAEFIGQGNFRYVAAQRLGVNQNTFQSWIQTGKKHIEIERDSLEAKLAYEVERAEAECHSRILSNVLASDDVKLQLEFLRLRYNKLYSKNPNAHHDDETGTTEKVDVAALLLEKLSQFAETE